VAFVPKAVQFDSHGGVDLLEVRDVVERRHTSGKLVQRP
jgi:hypothetical protein